MNKRGTTRKARRCLWLPVMIAVVLFAALAVCAPRAAASNTVKRYSPTAGSAVSRTLSKPPAANATPTISISSTYVTLNLSGTTTATVYVSVSGRGSDDKYTYQVRYDATVISCNWGSFDSSGRLSMTITALKACTNTPVTVSLLRYSDQEVLSTTTAYVTVKGATYTISYNANGGSGAPSSQTKKQDETLTLSSTIPTRFGYTFLGWATSSYATSPTYLPGATYTANTGGTLYAVWKQTTLSSGSSITTPITYGGQVYYYKFTPSSAGTYVIYSTGSADTKVYLYNASGSQLDYNDDVVSGSDRNFRLAYSLSSGATYYYAVRYYSSSTTGSISVKFGPVYSVTYNANGGTDAPSSQSKDYGASLTLSSSRPSKGKTQFLGWATSSGSSTVSYQPGDTVPASVNKDLHLYAVWNVHKHTYGAVKVVKATMTADGSRTKACTVCGKKVVVKVPRAGTVKLAQTSCVYTGKAITPTVTVKNSDGKDLTKGTDYTLTYGKGRKNFGTYAVKVAFKGNYTGSKTLNFKIVPGQVTGLKQQKRPGINIEWKAVKGASYYEVYQMDPESGKFSLMQNAEVCGTGNSALRNQTMQFKVRAVAKGSDGKLYKGAFSKVLTAVARAK